MVRLLLTAFRPFDEWDENSSWLALQAVTRELPPGAEVTTRLYPVDYEAVRERLAADLATPYDAVLHLGQASGASAVRLEQFALNARRDRGDAEEDVKPLESDGPAAYRSRLPLADWASELRGEGVPVEVSLHAGDYLCNAAMYWSHYLLEAQGGEPRVAFVHLPLDVSQAARAGREIASLPTEYSAHAAVMSKFAVLVLAAGRSSRFGDPNYKKPMAMLDGRAVWLHSTERFIERPDVCQTVVVVSPDDREEFQRKFGANLAFMGVDLCEGGLERADSVRAGLATLRGDATHVAVHDAARPLVTDDEIDRVFAAAVENHAAILATPVTATLKRVDDGKITATESRDGLWAAQTPQVFERALLQRANDAAGDAPVTDDAQLVELLGEPVAIVEGSPNNLKVTTQDDLKLAAAILAARPAPKPKGAHPFADDDLWR
ncbi:unnamed protein product [Cladocopium goreaui]|uniref:2-C-methyl-D-erythritol 4-phosphate cytidylyltransferase, chloroplastic n=1 Tax=Cladocopium goreaui TaxID=2562237 RepID=A0A9P1G1Q5_9DINO|nr:unnamed protein product [Cladocopium goreaui]